MVEYNRAGLYLETKTSVREKITAIEAIIDALIVEAANATSNEGISEYWLDDGQTKIKTVYRSAEEIMKGVRAFEQMKQVYVNRFNGRVSRLVPAKAFPNNKL